ncbi:hypothetical protein Scep_026056 [Stephania cephalantha]|uniref:Uncharacterized protein n=1 Tax=Stephania cephalantha TaxID=152367 RepID=A0AAP0HRQ8_9MAGN
MEDSGVGCANRDAKRDVLRCAISRESSTSKPGNEKIGIQLGVQRPLEQNGLPYKWVQYNTSHYGNARNHEFKPRIKKKSKIQNPIFKPPQVSLQVLPKQKGIKFTQIVSFESNSLFRLFSVSLGRVKVLDHLAAKGGNKEALDALASGPQRLKNLALLRSPL